MENKNNFGLKWKDALNAIIMMVIANLLMIVMSAADGEFPSLMDFKAGLISSVKFAIIPYLLKNFFTNDIKTAQKTLSSAKIDGNEAAKEIPPTLTEDKTD